MAININNQPLSIHSAGNDNWYSFNSTLRSFDDFALVASVYDGSNRLNTLTLPTNPDNISILNIKNIINDFTPISFNCFTTAATASAAFRNYRVDIAENFLGFYIRGGASGGVIATASVLNNTTISDIPAYTQVTGIQFLSGTVSDTDSLYIYSYATASNGYVNQVTLTKSNSSNISPSASVPLNTFGSMQLAGITIYSTGATTSTSNKTAIKGSIDYLDYNESNNYSGYVAGTSSSKFLTRAPKTLDIQPNEAATLTFINGTQSQPSLVWMVDNLGGTYSKSLSGLTNSTLLDIPSGTKNWTTLNPNATSYCVKLVRPITIATYSTSTWYVTDTGGGDWQIVDNQQLDITLQGGSTDTFTIFGDATLYGSPEDLYTFVVLYSYNEVTNATFKTKWDIQYVTGTGYMTFRLISKTTGTNYDLISYNITSSVPVLTYDSDTSGAPVPGFADASETRCFNISCLDTRWTPFRIAWLNSLGGVDYYTFKYISNSSKRITRVNFDKNLNYPYTNSSRGLTTYKLDNFDQWSVVSDPLSDGESEWLGDLFTSTEVYWLRNNSELIPITLIAEQYDRNIGLENNQLSLTFRLSRTSRK